MKFSRRLSGRWESLFKAGNMQAELTIDNSVSLSWQSPEAAVRVVVVRKTRDYPRNINDGIVVFDDAATTGAFTDTSPSNGYFNYYRVFFQDAGGAWLDVPTANERVRIRCEASFGYQDKLYNNLPELYAREDVSGELYRFLGIIAHGLEKFRTKQSGLNDLSNVNEVRDDMLEHLAWNVGWLLNRELPVLRQRAEIKRAVAIYKKKGTRRGLIDLIQGIMNWDMDVIKYNRNILTTNLMESTTLKISDPAVTMNMDSSADTADYVLGGDRSPNNISIKIKATYDFHLFEQVRNKLFRILSFWVPACMNVILELATFNEESGSISEWRPENADTLSLNWFITNDPQKETNSLLCRIPNMAIL